MLWLVLLLSTSAHGATRYCFAGGMEVYVEHRRDDPVVSVTTVVGGGARHEEPGEHGAAHLVEHLWFRSVLPDGRAVEAALDDLGAEANAFTSWDETTYVTVAPARSLPDLVALEARRLVDPLRGTEEVLDAERRVVQAELFENFDGRNPGTSALLRQLLPDDHPYRRAVGATPEEVAALDGRALESYVDRVYLAKRTTISIAGPVTGLEALQLVLDQVPSRYLDPRAKSDTPAAGTRCPDKRLPSEDSFPKRSEPAEPVAVPGPVHEPELVFGWALPPGPLSQDRAELLAPAVARRMRRQSTLNPRCASIAFPELTLLRCSAELDEEWADPGYWERRVATAMTGWFGRMSVTDESRWLGFLNYFSQHARRGWLLDGHTLSTAPWGYAVRTAERYHRTGLDRPPPAHGPKAAAIAMQWARGWLRGDQLAAVVVRPADEVETAGAAYHQERSSIALEEAAPVDRDTLAAWIEMPDLDGLHSKKLDNGTRLHVLVDERAKWPLVRLYFDGGGRLAADPVAADAAFLWLADPRRRLGEVSPRSVYSEGRWISAFQHQDAWVLDADSDDAAWGAEALAAFVRELDVVARPGERKADLVRLRQSRRRGLDRPEFHARELRNQHLLPDRPIPGLGMLALDRTEAMTRKEGSAIVRTMLRPEGAHLVVVGDVDPERVLASASIAYRRWLPSEAPTWSPEAEEELPLPQAQTWVLEQDRPRNQARITLSCRLDPGPAHGVRIGTAMLDSMLNRELRSTRGLTYGVHPWTWSLGSERLLEVSVQVPHDQAGLAVAALTGAVEQLADGKAPEVELAEAKLERVRKTALDFASVDRLPDLVFYTQAGEEGEEWDPVAALADLSPEDLARVFAPCSGHEAITVIGDRDRLDHALLGAGVDALPFAWERWK